MEIIIKNKSQSFQQIVIDLNVYLRSQPDWESWQDYFKTGSGQTIVDLIAGLGAQLFYLINIQRQETYLQTALNRSSVIGIAQMLGYSVNRGNAVKSLITIKSDTTQVLNYFNIVGTCKGVDVIMNESVLLNAGETKQIEVIMGTLKRDSIKVESAALQPFRMTKPNISSDYLLYKTADPYPGDDVIIDDKSNWVKLPTSEQFSDLANDQWVVQTNVINSVDVFYLNEGEGEHAYQYRPGDTIIIEYVELSNTEFSLTDIEFDYGEVISVDSVASYNPVERLASIKVNAPLANETQALIRARNDAKKLMIRNLPYLTAVNTQDITSEVVEVTYIKNDFTLLSQIEYDDVYDYLFEHRAFGILMPVISPPNRSLLELDIKVRLTNPLVRNSVIESVADMINLLQGKFLINNQNKSVPLDLEDMERQIEDLYGTKVARIYIKSPEYAIDQYYRTGQFVQTSPGNVDHFYKLDEILKQSGETEPTWPREIGQTIIDNQIQWVVKEEDNPDLPKWEPHTNYTYYATVLPTTPNGRQYEFKAFVGTSGDEEPKPPEGTNQITYDAELVWLRISKNAAAIPWTKNTAFPMGSVVSIESDPDNSYELITTRALSKTANPQWPNDENTLEGDFVIFDNMKWVYYKCRDERDDYRNPLLYYPWNQYLHVEYDLTITE